MLSDRGVFMGNTKRVNMNYYGVFNVSPTASSKEINDSHRTLAKKYHPDINNSEDAHEKMAMLNEAYEVLSDTGKREEYDKKLKQNEQQLSNRSAGVSGAVKTEWQRGPEFASKRAERAEQLRKKAEARLKAEESERMLRMAHAKKRAEEKAKEKARIEKQEEAEADKEQVVDLLSMLVRKGNARLRRNLDTDEARHHAVKVLLSLVREDDAHLRRLAEEAERKQRIDEILALVKAHNEGAK